MRGDYSSINPGGVGTNLGDLFISTVFDAGIGLFQTAILLHGTILWHREAREKLEAIDYHVQAVEMARHIPQEQWQDYFPVNEVHKYFFLAQEGRLDPVTRHELNKPWNSQGAREKLKSLGLPVAVNSRLSLAFKRTLIALGLQIFKQ